jgi:hypothetical protein
VASIYTAETLGELRKVLRELDAPGLVAQELVNKGAMHALNRLERIGCTPQNLAAMQASLREAAAVVTQEARRRGLPSVDISDG